MHRSSRVNWSRMIGILFRRSIPTLVFITFLFFLFPFSAKAATDWRSYIEQEVADLLAELDKQSNIFVVPPVDGTGEGRYFPFLDTSVRQVLTEAVRNHGYIVPNDANDSDTWLRSKFNVRNNLLRITLTIHDRASKTDIGSTIFEIPGDRLPGDWKARSLRDIAFELAGKIKREFFPERLSITVGEFSVGEADTDAAYVSDLSIVIRGYVREELGKLRSVSLRKTDTASSDTYRLAGHFQNLGNGELLLRLSVSNPISGVEKIVSTRFGIESVPQGTAILPDNVEVVAQTDDVLTSGVESKVPERQLTIRLNHEDPIYREGEKLILYITPYTDLYIRIYYIQADGLICQIFPLDGREGSVKSGKVKILGDYWESYIIGVKTTGQETIKVFASLKSINDESMPIGFSSDTQRNCTKDHEDLKKTFRSMTVKSRVHLVGEVKILVTKTPKK